MMSLSIVEKSPVVLGRRNMSVIKLSQALRQSKQNLSNKLTQDNFTTKVLAEIAEVLASDHKAFLTMKDTKETI